MKYMNDLKTIIINTITHTVSDSITITIIKKNEGSTDTGIRPGTDFLI